MPALCFPQGLVHVELGHFLLAFLALPVQEFQDVHSFPSEESKRIERYTEVPLVFEAKPGPCLVYSPWVEIPVSPYQINLQRKAG